MDSLALTLGVTWTSVGLLIAASSIPLVRGRIPPNRFYGVRFRECYQSDEAWFAINRFGGKHLLLWSVPTVLLGIAAFFLPLRSHPLLSLIFAPLLLVFVLTPTIQTARFAKSFRPKA